MALFKISKGLKANLPLTKKAGNCWYTTDDSLFYIDYEDENGVVQRKALNAKDAEKLSGASLSTILTGSEVEIPTSKAVFDAIEASKIIHIGPDEPTDPNIKVWINTVEEGVGVIPVLPRVATITLAANAWSGNAEPYSQPVDVATATPSSKIDLQPTAQQIVSLQNAETSLMVENNGGSLTCYAIGNKPTVNYTMQVLIQEVAYV